MDDQLRIRYVTADQVNREKWDHCIVSASNSRIYAQSGYMDAMCAQWDALVAGDYRFVMPLPWRKKWAVHYLYYPFLTAQLGVFGNDVTAEVLEHFLTAIPPKFSYWDFPLNAGNLFSLSSFPLQQRKNYILSLKEGYETIAGKYRDSTRRNIKRSQQYPLQIKKDIPLSTLIELNRMQAGGEKGSSDDYRRFENAFRFFNRNNKAKTYGIYLNEVLVASAAFLFDNRRAYYLLVGNHPNSRSVGASHRLIDSFIRDHAASNLILDFEGSDIDSLAFFYSSFGAVEENYPSIHMNRLPFYLKWLKR